MRPGRHAHIAIGGLTVSEAADELDVFCTAERLPDDAAWRLRVALDEIVANIVAHSPHCPAATGAAVDVWFCRDGAMVEVIVADDGPAFDPLARTGPDVSAPLEWRQPGGLGIALVKALMDEVRYERTSRNVLTIRKRLDASPAAGAAGADEHSPEQS